MMKLIWDRLPLISDYWAEPTDSLLQIKKINKETSPPNTPTHTVCTSHFIQRPGSTLQKTPVLDQTEGLRHKHQQGVQDGTD